MRSFKAWTIILIVGLIFGTAFTRDQGGKPAKPGISRKSTTQLKEKIKFLDSNIRKQINALKEQYHNNPDPELRRQARDLLEQYRLKKMQEFKSDHAGTLDQAERKALNLQQFMIKNGVEVKQYDPSFKQSSPENSIDQAVIFFDDFETDPFADGWTTEDLTAPGQDIFFHTDTYNAFGGSGLSWWCGTDDPLLLATPPGYGNDWQQYLLSPVIDLSGVSSASFSYDLKYDSEPGFDFIYVQISTDGGLNWDDLDVYSGAADWATYVQDISAYVGGTVLLRFFFSSDFTFSDEDGFWNTDGACYVDNMTITKDGVPELLDDGGDTIESFTPGTPLGEVGSFWHWTDFLSNSPTHSVWSADPNTQTYPIGYFDALVSPPIDIPADLTEKPVAEFYIWFDLGLLLDDFHRLVSFDAFWIEISTDLGETWDLFSNFLWLGSTGGWIKYPDDFGGFESGDLSLYVGETVMLRIIVWDWPDGVTGLGAFVDDFSVTTLPDPYEPNNTPETAYPIGYGFASQDASIFPQGDLDAFVFQGTEGDWVSIWVDNFFFDAQVTLFDDAWNIIGFSDGIFADHILLPLPYTGSFFILIEYTFLPLDDAPTGCYTFYLDVLNPYPDILLVEDIPDDQGLQVRVTFRASDFEFFFLNLDYMITEYSLWRMIPQAASQNQNVVEVDNINELSPQELKNSTGIVYKINGALWDFITSIPAAGLSEYGYVAPTLQDGISSVFAAAAHMSPNLFQLWGTSGSGTSIDNIPPEFLDLSLNVEPSQINLAWSVDTGKHFDITNFKVYRSTTSGFTPSDDNLIGLLDKDATGFSDTDVVEGTTYYYIVDIADDGGNVTRSSELSGTITGIADHMNTLPTEFLLLQNYPNPFNPSTTIEFGLPREAVVQIEIYDMLGQRVRTLLNDRLTAGFHSVQWDGRNSQGDVVPSGIYFYKMIANSKTGKGIFSRTQKMVMIK